MTARLQLLFFTILFFCFLTACRKEESNPELLDPIYSDLAKRKQDVEGKIEDQKKKLEKASQDLAAALPNTLDLKNAMRDQALAIHTIHDLQQKLRYLKIRADRRLLEDKYNYHLAFLANKDWPEKGEYEAYLTNERLVEAPRMWDARVPKLFDRKPAIAAPVEKKESAE